ncbi:MAG: tRNA dihydrouridine synthase DusB [Candidatus Edwardsbacteria bacterium]
MSFSLFERIKGKIVLAPMAGITDSSFRLLAKRFGAALVYSEMISAEGVVRGNTNSLRLLYFKQEEQPIGIQIFGTNPEALAKAAQKIEKLGASLIDFNLGCPVRKVVKTEAGAGLLRKPKQLQKIVNRITKSVNLPVTAKIRSGWDRKSVNAVEIAQLLEECGLAGITVHARTKTEEFDGEADWKVIKQVKEKVKIFVIGNGDVKTPEDAKKMFELTNCDAVMIGRAALGNPWIFPQTQHFLNTGELLPPPSTNEIVQTALTHLELACSERGEYQGVRQMKRHLGWYTRGLPQGARFRDAISKVEKLEKIKELLGSLTFFSDKIE